MAVIGEDVLNDPTAVSIAQAVAIANRHAQGSGVDAAERRLTVKQQQAEDGTPLWRVNYGLIPPPGTTIRGGDFIVEINANDGTVYRTLRGQ